MSKKGHHKKDFFKNFRSELSDIINDIIYVYKNFLHWNISKICVSIWSLILGLIFFLPIFLIAGLIALIDPIEWVKIVQFIVTGQDISLELVSNIAAHPFWLVAVGLVIATAFIAFLFASSYSLFLLSKIGLAYTKRKPLALKKNLYASKNHISVYIRILMWNSIYIISPCIIFVGLVFFMYLFFNAGVITFDVLSSVLITFGVIGVLFLLYALYRLLFGYIILAADTKKRHLHSGRHYVNASIKITSGWKKLVKFACVMSLYILVLFPFNSLGSIIDQNDLDMRNALAYKTGLIESVDKEKMKYYEYITAEYSDYTSEDLVDKISLYTWYKLLYFIFSYLVFGSLFIMITTSFYKRVLDKK